MKTQKLSSVDLTPLVEKKQLFGVKNTKKVQVRLSKANSALKLACCYIKYLQNKKNSQLLTYFFSAKIESGLLTFLSIESMVAYFQLPIQKLFTTLLYMKSKNW